MRNQNIGNINNPSIAKWGLNLFWYNYWFADYKYHDFLHQDKLLRFFLHTYINFGLFFPKHPFFSKYWFKTPAVNFNYDKIFNSQYFREHNTPYDESDNMGKYKLRNRIDCMYASRMWILRYDNWFIISFYCLRPKETDLVRKKKKIKKNAPDKLFFDVSLLKTSKKFKRLKLLILYYYLYKNTFNKTYIF